MLVVCLVSWISELLTVLNKKIKNKKLKFCPVFYPIQYNAAYYTDANFLQRFPFIYFSCLWWWALNFQVVLTPTHLAIVMEYAAGGELFERICSAGRFSEDEVL